MTPLYMNKRICLRYDKRDYGVGVETYAVFFSQRGADQISLPGCLMPGTGGIWQVVSVRSRAGTRNMYPFMPKSFVVCVKVSIA